MRLSTLLKDILSIPAAADCEVLDLKLDSRHVKKNDLFLAIKGTVAEGSQYISSAIERGAVAV